MISSSRLLVTGASGFLGTEIVRLARAAGWQVRVLVRNSEVRVEDVEIFKGDITDSNSLHNACADVSAVVHAAGLAHVFGRQATGRTQFTATNENGTANVIDAAVNAGVSQIVLVSSVSVYGMHSKELCDETTPCHPLEPYASSKWLSEVKAVERVANWPGCLRILRFATIYGEGDRGNVSKLIRALNRGRFIWPGTGLNRKSLIYKADAARACLCALERPVPGTEVFNVSAQPVTLREIVVSICRALDRPMPRFGFPLTLLRSVTEILAGPGTLGQLGQQLQKVVRDDAYDASKFEAAFDFHPAFSLSEGICRQVSFTQAQAR